MNIHFRCLESRIDKNNTLYGKFSLNSILSGQGNTFANSLRRSLFSDLSGLAITHFCITSKPGLNYEFATLPGLTESLLDFSLNLKKVVLTGRVIDRAYTHSETLTSFGYTTFGRMAQGVPTTEGSPPSVPTTQSYVDGVKRYRRSYPLRNSAINVEGGDGIGIGSANANAITNERTLLSTSILEARSNKLFNRRKKLLTALPLAPIGFLKAKGPAVLRASDLILPPGICCVHPNQYLGTLAADGALSIKILIAVGKGFIVQDEILYNSLSRAKLSFSSNAMSYSNLQNSFPLNKGTYFGMPCNKSKIQSNGKSKATTSGRTSTGTYASHRPTEGSNHRKTARPQVSDNEGYDSKDQKAHKIQKQEPNGKKISSVRDRGIFTSTTYLPPLSIRRFKKPLVTLPQVSVNGHISTTATFGRIRPQAASLARHLKVMNQNSNQRRFLETSRRRIKDSTTPLSTRFIKIQNSRYYLASCILLLPKPLYCQGRKDLIWSTKQPENTQNIIKLSNKTNNFYEKIPINLRFNGFSQLLPMATKALSHFFTKNLSAMSLSDLIFIVQSSSKIKSKTFIPNSYPIDKLTNSSKTKNHIYSLPIIQSASTFQRRETTLGDAKRREGIKDSNTTARSATGGSSQQSYHKLQDTKALTRGELSNEAKSLRLVSPIVQSDSETKQKEDLKDATHRRFISQNKKVRSAFFGAKYNRYSDFNNGLEKEKLLTISYKAQSNKFSPFLFVAIPHKKAKNKSLLPSVVFNTSLNLRSPKIIHNTLQSTIASPALRQGSSTEQATCIPVLKQGCSPAQKIQNNTNIFAGIKKQKVSRTIEGKKLNSKKVRKVDNGAKQAAPLLRAPRAVTPTTTTCTSTEGRRHASRRIEDSTSRRSGHSSGDATAGQRRVVNCLPYVPAQNLLPYGSFTTIVNTSKKLSKKQLIWGAEQNFYPVLPLDVTFSPVSKVNFQINVDRNSEKNEEAIIFEIWTNGSITPKRAMQESCLALAQDFYNLFCHVNEFSRLRFWWKRDSLEFKATTMGSVTNNRFVLSEGDSLVLKDHKAISPSATSEARLVLSNTPSYDPIFLGMLRDDAAYASHLLPSETLPQVSVGDESKIQIGPKLVQRTTWGGSAERCNIRPPSKEEPIRESLISKKFSFLMTQPTYSRKSTVHIKQIKEQNQQNTKNFKNRDSEIYDPFIQKGLAGGKYTEMNRRFALRTNASIEGSRLAEAAKSSNLTQICKTNKIMHSQIKTCTKLNFSQSKNFKLKQKVYYLHAFWRLNISDLNFSLKTQLVLKKLNINSVYDLHSFILKKSWSLFLDHQQQKEIIKIYLNFGLNSPF